MRSITSTNNKPEKPKYVSGTKQDYDREAARAHESGETEVAESKSDNQNSYHSSPQKNPKNSEAYKKTINIYETEDNDPNSILNRIQLNKKNDKDRKMINIRKGDNDGIDEFDLSRIQRKTISKGPPKIITRPSAKQEGDKYSKSDPYKISGQTTVVLSNLSQNVTAEILKDIIKDDSSIVSFKLEDGSAEIQLKTQDQARAVVEELDMRILKGSKVRATLARELNLPSYLTERHRFDHLKTGEEEMASKQEEIEINESKIPSQEQEERLPELPIYFYRDQNREVEEQEESEKPSILLRIKKKHSK